MSHYPVYAHPTPNFYDDYDNYDGHYDFIY